MRSLKHLSFQSLRHGLRLVFRDIPDRRQKGKLTHSMHDVVMSGFAMNYFQDESLLQFQGRLLEFGGKSNLQSIFGVETIPQDSQMREVLDEVDREKFRPVFKNWFHRLQRGKHLEQFQLPDGSYLCVMDGTQYFGSDKVHCSSCLRKEHRNGTVSYSHHILQGAVVYPGIRQVIPLMPEEIRNTGGTEKQDCEINAGKRFIEQLRKDHPQLKVTLGGDGINSHQPLIEVARRAGMNFILVAKPDDHKIMMEWVDEQKKMGELSKLSVVDGRGRTHVYEWVNGVPLNGNKDTIEVNFFRYQLIVEDDRGERKITYRNSWVTDFEISKHNVAKMADFGRCRWKIENEFFNTLKNQGYNIEHSYGHGVKNLSFNFLLLTLFAFFSHQISELTDDLFKECRKKLGSKRHLWETVRSAIKFFVFDTWEMLFQFILAPRSFQPTLIKPG